MRVRVDTLIDLPVETAWSMVNRSDTLVHIAAPILAFRPIDPPTWPETWKPGRYRAGMRFLGILPLGRQWIDISHPDPAPDDPAGTRRIRDNGSGHLARRWDHMIVMSPASGDKTLYRDDVDIEAGLLTPFIWLFAQGFYRWRQHRWRRLARSRHAAPAPS